MAKPLVFLLAGSTMDQVNSWKSTLEQNLPSPKIFVTDQTDLAVDMMAQHHIDFLILDMESQGIDLDEIMYFAANYPDIKITGMYRGLPDKSPSLLNYTLSYDQLKNLLDQFLSVEAKELPILDLNIIQGILSLADDGENQYEFLGKLVQMFQQRMAKIERELEVAIQSQDAKGLESLAHALKGTSGNVGAMRMFHLCAELEENGRIQNFIGAPELLDSIRRSYKEACASLYGDWLSQRAS